MHKFEEALHASQGWYYDKNATSLSLRLIDQSVVWSQLQTMFIEVIVTEQKDGSTAPQLTCYGNAPADITFGSTGHRLIVIKNSPFVYESLTDNTLGPYFPQLSVNLLNKCDIITTTNTDTSGSVIITIPCDIEVLSFGWKKIGELPVHYQTKWHSTNVDPLVRSLENYILLTKDAQIDVEQPSEVNDAVYHVKAYGDFVEGNYQQTTTDSSYNNIIVNTRLNKDAVENALYILENASLNNYTINASGLRYRTDSVALVDCSGNVVYKADNSGNLLDGVMVANQYIMADFQGAGSVNSITEDTYITTQTNNLKVFNKKGGMAPVILEGVYAALFKEFNKSGSIINSSLCSNIYDTIWKQVNKPAAVTVSLSGTDASLNNFTQNVIYRYKVTYAHVDTSGNVVNGLETDASEASNIVTQGLTCKRVSIALKKPINVDLSFNSANAPANGVNSIRIYRERGLSGKFILLKQLEPGVSYTLAANGSTDITFSDDNPENVNVSHLAPTQNNFSIQVTTGNKLTQRIVDQFNEDGVPSTSSKLFKLYEASGRLAKDNSVYGLKLDKRGGGGIIYDACGNALHTVTSDVLNRVDCITMNLENMELRFKIKMNGSIFDASGSNLTFSKEQLSKQLAETVFGKYNNGTGESQTLVRVVKRTSPLSTEGIDEKGHIMTMLNNMTDTNGNYIVNTEIQYEIIFKISLIQKSDPHIA
jgi:hypothetical protein